MNCTDSGLENLRAISKASLMTTARGSVGESQQLRDGGAQQIPVNRSHAFHAPMLGMPFNETIDFAGAVGGDPKQVFGKALDIGTHVPLLAPKGLAYLLGSLLSHVALEKHLQRKFAGFAAGSQSQSLVVRRWSLALTPRLVYRAWPLIRWLQVGRQTKV